MRIFVLPLFWLLTACSFSQPIMEIVPLRPEEIPQPAAIVDSAAMTSIAQTVSTNFEHDHHLQLEHANTFYKDGISSVQLQFISQDIIEICEARELIVDLAESLLATINQDPVVGPDLANYPFQPSNLEIYITFESYYGKFCDPYHIAWICLEDARVTFYTFDLLDHLKQCWHKRVEAYPTAREIVVYQREAEHKYDEAHLENVNIFGSARYYPPSQSKK
jgi:hypothetical protein